MIDMARNSAPRVHRDGEVFTTGQVARICKVAPRTVAKWCDGGLLGSYRIPGSLDRRVPREALVEFCRAHEVPFAEATWGRDAVRILLVSFDPADAAGLAEAAGGGGIPFDVRLAAGAFAAGRESVSFAPRVIVADVAGLGRIDAIQVAETMRGERPGGGRARPSAPTLIAATEDGESATSLLDAGYDVVARPSMLAAELAKVAAGRG